MVSDRAWMPRRLFRKAVQQGRSEQRGESYSVLYVEPLSDARTPLADFVNNLLVESVIPYGQQRSPIGARDHMRIIAQFGAGLICDRVEIIVREQRTKVWLRGEDLNL